MSEASQVMQKFSFTALAEEIQDIKEEGVTFEDKALTWDTADDVKDLVEALENQKIVHFLKLEGNTLGVDAAKAIGKALERHPEFRKALWRNMFTRRLKSEIPVALKHMGNGLMVANAQLAVLDLSDNALGPNGMVGLEALLRSRVCYSLQELYLNNCGLGIGGGKMLSEALIDCHRTSTAAATPLQLKIFVTGRNRLENEGAEAIAKIFSTIKTLQHISMPQNSIYFQGVEALAAGIKECKQLQVLNLNDNTLTDTGASFLADALQDIQSLRELNLGDCLLKTNGAYVWAEAFQHGHTGVQVVNFAYNEIGADAGLALSTALRKKPLLKTVDLNGNAFGYEGREQIMEIWKGTNILQSLDDDESECEEGSEEEQGHALSDDYEEECEEGDEVYSGENDNETTEEADEDDDYPYGEEEEEAAYITSQPYNTKTFANNTLTSNKSVTFVADNPTTPTGDCSAETFCLSQSPCKLQMFEKLPGDNKFKTLKDFIDQFKGDNYLLLLIFTTLKCAHLSQESSAALELAKQLFADLFAYIVKEKQERRVINYLLIQLGLLRSERKFKSDYNISSCRFALTETLKAKKLPSDYIHNTLNVFLEESTKN